ncbi:MAG: hypothetical protein PHW76_08235 [Alphaproteobacteria bacterium]|nr:hypothetical protein [Alphaproteobacteria bacterium]
MFTLGKMLGLAAINGVAHSTHLFQKFLSGMIIVIVLAVISSIMLAALIVGGIFALYASLVNAGLASLPAILVIVGLLAVITAMLFGITLWQMKQLKDGAEAAINPKAADHQGIGGIVLSFIEGFSD